MKPTSKWLVIGVAAVVVLIAVAFLFGPKLFLYGKVGNQTISLSQVKALARESVPYTTTQIGDTLMDLELYRSIASGMSISVSNAEINAEIKLRTGKDEPYGVKYLRAAVEKDLLQQKIQKAVTKSYQGKFIVARFDQNQASDAGTDDPKNPPAGRAERIAADRAYATRLIESLYDQLGKGTLTFEQAIQKEIEDPKIGVAAFRFTTVHSGSFDTANPNAVSSQLFDSPDIKDQLAKLQVGSYTKPFPVRINIAAGPTPKLVDGMWMIVKLEKTNEGKDMSFDQLVTKSKQELGYRKYQ